MKNKSNQTPANFSKVSKVNKKSLVHVKYIEVENLQSSKINADTCFHPISRMLNL